MNGLWTTLTTLLGWQDVAAWLTQRPWPWPDLAQPLALWLWLVPLGFLLANRWRQRRVLRYADPALRPWVQVRHSAHRRQQRLIEGGFGVFWLMAVLALAHPQVPKNPATDARWQPPVMLLIDTSAAMSVRDVSPSRTARAQVLAQAIANTLPANRLGLMQVSDSAGLLLPPSTDRALFRDYLALLPALSHPLPPVRSDQAFAWLAQLPELKGGAVLWLTAADEQNFSGALGSAQLAGADALRHAGIRLYALPIAGAGGAMMAKGQPIKDNDDAVLTSVPAPDRAAELARLTGGSLINTASLPQAEQAVRSAIESLPALPPVAAPGEAMRSLAALPLTMAGLALALALLGLMRRPPREAMALLALLTLLPLGFAPSPTQAADVTPAPTVSAGEAALRSGNFAEAQVTLTPLKGFAARFGTGVAAFRRADYPYAIAQWQTALWLAPTDHDRARTVFNLGNALLMAGRDQAARDAYQAAGRWAGADKNLAAAAQENLSLVEKLLQSAAKNGKTSPKFQGIQIANYGYAVDPAHSQMDKTVQQFSGEAMGSTARETPSTPEGKPFVLDPATETSARAKLDQMHDTPAPLLDRLLHQQQYQQPAVPTEPGVTP